MGSWVGRDRAVERGRYVKVHSDWVVTGLLASLNSSKECVDLDISSMHSTSTSSLRISVTNWKDCRRSPA